jgi:hypothetical protein
MTHRPLLTRAARPATFIVDAHDETGEHRPTPIAGEHPLTLYVDKREILTMMTLGAAPEALAIGFLRNQRLVKSLDEIVSVQVDWDVAPLRRCSRLSGGAHGRPRRPCGRRLRRPDGDLESIRLPRTRLDERRFSACSRVDLQGSRRGARLRACQGFRDPHLRGGRRPPQCRGRDRRLDVAGGHRRGRQDLLHHRSPHLGDGDQGGADGHPLPRFPLGAHEDGPRDRPQGRHHLSGAR